jgi:hypothetical protein
MRAIIIFTILLFYFSGKSQNEIDTVTIVNKRAGVNYYYQKGEQLNFSKILDITKENKTAYKQMQQAYNLRTAGICFYVAGGASFGFSLGYLIVGMTHNNIKTAILLPSLGASFGLIVCGGICGIFANVKIQRGINVYNNLIKQT